MYIFFCLLIIILSQSYLYYLCNCTYNYTWQVVDRVLDIQSQNHNYFCIKKVKQMIILIKSQRNIPVLRLVWLLYNGYWMCFCHFDMVFECWVVERWSDNIDAQRPHDLVWEMRSLMILIKLGKYSLWSSWPPDAQKKMKTIINGKYWSS